MTEQNPYTVSIYPHGYLALIRPHVQWFFICQGRARPAYTVDGPSRLELNRVERKPGEHSTILRRYNLLQLHPHLLGNFSWSGGYTAIIRESVETETMAYCLEVTFGVVNPHTFRPWTNWNNTVQTGAGEYAWVRLRRPPGEHRWQYEEAVYQKEPGKMFFTINRTWNDHLTACRYPGWVIQQLADEYLPRIENWLVEQDERRNGGFTGPVTPWDLYPTGNPPITSKNV